MQLSACLLKIDAVLQFRKNWKRDHRKGGNNHRFSTSVWRHHDATAANIHQ